MCGKGMKEIKTEAAQGERPGEKVTEKREEPEDSQAEKEHSNGYNTPCPSFLLSPPLGTTGTTEP